jgi:uracil-DNA glycosylase
MKLQDRFRRDFGDWRGKLPPAWRDAFDGVELGFDDVDPAVEIGEDEPIWPQAGIGGPEGADTFKALRGLAPEEVRVVIFGNDPYTKLRQATGRSFEQGDLTDWAVDAKDPGRISPSLETLLCAAAATSPAHAEFDLLSREDLDPDEGFLWKCHQELTRGLVAGAIALPPPRAIFDHWAGQGVLWLNRTLTYSRWLDDHRPNHTRLWAPFTARAIRAVLAAAARRGTPLVFALWGAPAQQLQPAIEAETADLGLPSSTARFARAGHPQLPDKHFRDGNSLAAVNELLEERPIRWA